MQTKNMVNSSYLVRIGITKISTHGCNSGINVREITNYFLIKYKVCSTGEKIIFLVLIYGQYLLLFC